MTWPTRTRSALFILVVAGVLAGAGGAACGGDERDGGDDDERPARPCDPTTQARCGDGEKCTWIRTAASEDERRGEAGCVPAGTAAVGDPCSYGAAGTASGYDDCAAGLICLAPA